MGKTIVNSVPVYIPIFWQQWDGSPEVMSMNVMQEGIYFRFCKKQWVYDELPADPWQLSKLLNVEYRVMKRWMDKYHAKLAFTATCQRCDSESSVTYQQVVSDESATCQRCDSDMTVKCHNLKLRNLKNDVNSGVPLGHTEKKPNQEETETKTEPIKLAERSEAPPDSNLSVPSQEKVRTPSGIGVKIVPKFEPKPAPAPVPKVVSGPALVAAKHFWSCMDEPSSYTPEDWAESMESLLAQSKLSPDQFLSFLTWATKENYDNKDTRNSVAYLAKAGNPMASLEKNFVYEDGGGLLRNYKARLKSGLAAQVKTSVEDAVKHKNTPAMNQPQHKIDFYARNQAAAFDEDGL